MTPLTLFFMEYYAMATDEASVELFGWNTAHACSSMRFSKGKLQRALTIYLVFAVEIPCRQKLITITLHFCCPPNSIGDL
jgi:hypothetical protein